MSGTVAETDITSTAEQTAMSDNEVRYFDALKRIANYTPPDWMKRDNARGQGYGLDADEEIEMAYENVILEAKLAIKGKRRPLP